MADYKKNRATGSFTQGGRTYTRQDRLTRIVLGNRTQVAFTLDYAVPGKYAIIDANDLQPSHLGSAQNPLHFIPEAQPRNRSTSASGALTPERIAKNLRPDELMYGTTAYTGAPVVNGRGEVIQGNGRGMAVKTYHNLFPDDPKGYRQAIEDGNARFGFLFTKHFGQSLVDMGIFRPVLVRLVDVSDKEAIQLGQFTQADTEAVATSTTKIKSKARLLTKPVLKRVLTELARTDSGEKTLAELIRESRVLQVLIKEEVIRPDDLENYTPNGAINEEGVNFVSSLLLNATFQNADVNTADVFTGLPVNTQTAVKKSTLFMLRCTGPKSLNSEVSEAILAYREFAASSAPTIASWKNQYDINSQTAGDRYSSLALAIADLFHQSSTQKQVVQKFRQYATLVNGGPGDMFTPASKGATKREAAKIVFNANFSPDQEITRKKRNARIVVRTAKKRTGTPRRAAVTSAASMPKPKPDPAKLQVGRKAKTLKKLQDRAPVKPRIKTPKQAPVLVGAAPVISPSSINNSTEMTATEKKAFAARMAKGKADKAKKGKKSTTPKKRTTTKKTTASAKPKVKPAAKPKAGAKPKVKPAAKPRTRKAAAGSKAKGSKTVKSAGKRKTATKRATVAKTTTRVPSKRQLKGLKYLEERDRIAEDIHKKSATGETKKVPVYRISISQAKKRAEKALSQSKKTGNVTSIRLKVK
jgi:hypothetical protein